MHAFSEAVLFSALTVIRDRQTARHYLVARDVGPASSGTVTLLCREIEPDGSVGTEPKEESFSVDDLEVRPAKVETKRTTYTGISNTDAPRQFTDSEEFRVVFLPDE